MTKTVNLPEKPRRHKWVTEALNQGDTKLSVWPSPDDLKNQSKQKRFMETIGKIGNDPRVINIEKHPHDVYNVVFVFDLQA